MEAARLLQRRCRSSEHWDMTCCSVEEEERLRHGMKGHGALETSVSSGGEMFYVAYVYVKDIWEWRALTPKPPIIPNPKILDLYVFEDKRCVSSSSALYAAP